MEAIANALLSCPVSDVTKIYCLLTLKKQYLKFVDGLQEAKKLPAAVEEEDGIDWSSSDDDTNYTDMLNSDDEV